MLIIQQNEATAARRRVPMHLVDATDGITPETGEAGGQPQISENGAAFVNTAATLTAIGNGAYYVELAVSETNVVGFSIVRYKSAATAEAQVLVQVVAFDPYTADLGIPSAGNLINLNDSITSRASQVTADAIEAQTDDIGVAGAGLTAIPWNAAWDVEVQSEVVDALNVDTYAEPAQGAPPAAPTIRQMIHFLYKSWRNKKDNDGANTQLYADDATTVDHKQATSESGGTVTKGEWTTGP